MRSAVAADDSRAAFQAARGHALDDETYLDGITTETVSVQARRLIGARAYAQARVAWFATTIAPARPSASSTATR